LSGTHLPLMRYSIPESIFAKNKSHSVPESSRTKTRGNSILETVTACSSLKPSGRGYACISASLTLSPTRYGFGRHSVMRAVRFSQALGLGFGFGGSSGFIRLWTKAFMRFCRAAISSRLCLSSNSSRLKSSLSCTFGIMAPKSIRTNTFRVMADSGELDKLAWRRKRMSSCPRGREFQNKKARHR